MGIPAATQQEQYLELSCNLAELKKIKECKEDTVLEVFGECENKYCCNELFKGKKKKETCCPKSKKG